jgi:hypothetical protein
MIWADEDPTEDEAPLACPGCSAVGDAPCDAGCVYADAPEPLSAEADRWLDERLSDHWEDIF